MAGNKNCHPQVSYSLQGELNRILVKKQFFLIEEILGKNILIKNKQYLFYIGGQVHQCRIM
jgi:hypothetical protein